MSDAGAPQPSWSDRRLVDRCLAGDERAWSALVDKYTNLVAAVIRKYGLGSEDVADVFQAIWLDAYNDLPKLRQRSAFKAWLITLARNKCYHWKRRWHRRHRHEVDERWELEEPGEEPEFVERLERDQLVRQAIFELPERCRELVRLLFFRVPPLPYKEVAERLGLATGSIGFIRGRCLKKLQRSLQKRGVK